MSEKNMIKRIEDLKELEAFIFELEQEANGIRDEIKQVMIDEKTEEMEAGQYIIRWTNVITNRFDSARFKKDLPEIYKAFLKQSISKRFSISD